MASANAEIHGRHGIHIVTDDAMALATLPEPTGDHRSAWLWNEHYGWDMASVSVPQHLVEIDTKPKRRLPMLSTLAWIVESNGLSAGSVIYNMGARILMSMK